MENNYGLNFFSKKAIFITFLLVTLFVSSIISAQVPIFENPTYIDGSGTDKTAGAKYIYYNVVTVDGVKVDAVVTINGIKDAVLVDVDNANNGSGLLLNRFQPTIKTTKDGGYVEFIFEFYKSGTYFTSSKLLVELNSFKLEALDIDGNEYFEAIIPSTAYYTLNTPTTLTVSTTKTPPFTRFQGETSSVDPIKITDTPYIAVVNYPNTNTVKFRYGRSIGNSNVRQYSLSFGEVSFDVPTAPVAVKDSKTDQPTGNVSLNVTLNDSDANNNLDKGTVDLNQTLSGVQNSLIVSGEGTWSVDSDGMVTFTPLATFKADPTPIKYTIKDTTGLVSNQASITITYVKADLLILKIVNNSSPNFSENVIFTLKVTNNGPNNATGVIVGDLLPSGYTYVSDNGSSNYNSSTGKWTIGSIENSGTATLTITAKVKATGAYENIASVSGNEYDTDLTNNISKSKPTPKQSTVTITTIAANFKAQCNGSGNTTELNNWLSTHGGASATTTCSNTSITWTHDYTALSNLCGATGSATVTFTAKDNCGNTATTTATFTISDDIYPTFTSFPNGNTNNQPLCENMPALKFTSYTEVSGDGNINTFLLNEVFKFPNVAPNIYALVKINGLQNATVKLLDDNSNSTSTDGFTPQTNFSVNGTGQQAWIEYKIDFYDATTNALVNMPSFYANFSDIDGNNNFAEQNWTELTADYTVDSPTELTISNSSQWIVATAGTTEYNGVSNSNPQVNISARYQGVTGLIFRVGVISRNGSQSGNGRQHNVEFGCSTNYTTPSTITDEITVECDSVPAAETLTATDNCGNAVVTFNEVKTNGNCANNYVLTRTWTATDECGKSVKRILKINVKDTKAPTWTSAASSLNKTIQCSDASGLTTAQALAPVATDNCGGTVTYTKTSGTFVAGSCANSGTYTNTWIAKDVCLNTSTTFTQVITIIDNTAPTWTSAASSLNKTIQCSDASGLTAAQALAPVATDNCGGTVTYTKTSGAFVAGSCANSGTYTNTWIAKDVCLNTSTTFTQVITIIDNTAPTWTTVAENLNRTIQCSDASGLTAAQALTTVATDNCGGTVTYTKTSGAFVAGSCANSGTYTNTWIAKDVCLNTSTTFTQVITIIDNTAPTWTSAASSLNKTIQCSDASGLTTAQALAPVATDNCGGTVTYTKTSGAFVVGSCANSGTYTNTWIAKDVCLNTSTTFTQVITIIDNTAPTWTSAASSLNKTIQCSDASGLTAAQALAPVATDNCGGTVTYTKTSGAFVVGSCANSGTYTNTWVAKDVCLNTSTTFTQVITIIDNTAPTWTSAASSLNKTIQCSDASGLTTAQALAPVATDNCGGTVTYTKTSGAFVAGSCANSGTYTNTWIAKDVCLNTSTTFTQVITIEDTTAPIFETLPAETSISYTATPSFQQAVATDNCSNVTLTYKDVASTPNCNGSYSITRTWTAKDLCLNISTATQTININEAKILAKNDIGNSVNGFTGGTSFTNVLGNDTFDNQPVLNSQVTTSFVSSTNSGITLSGTNVLVAPGTPSGNYSLTYKICSVSANCACSTATVSVKVFSAIIDAIDDVATTPVNGFVGGIAFTNVLVNDKLNGVLVDPTKVTTSFVSATNAGITLVGTDVNVVAGTPAGNYELVYKICENINPLNCDEAKVTLTVAKPVIDAIDDVALTAVNGFVGGTAFTNVLVNDKLNNVIVDPAKVTTSFVSATNAGITLVGTDVKVAPGTPAGDYELVYKICENINLTTNCDDAIVKVKVSAATIEANDDTAPTAVNGLAGGTAFTNVLVNDKLNGVLVDPTKVTTSFVSATNAGITLVGTDVKVAPGTPAGDYELVYKICENINLTTNCDDAIVKVKVSAATIEANDDTAPTAVNGLVGGTAFTNVLVNDKLNGVLVDPTKVTTSFVSATNAGITLVGTDVKVAPGTPAGDYELVYKICENINLTTNCDDAIVKVKVSAATIEANDDTAPTAVNGLVGGTAFTNVLVNDKLNGVLVDPTKVTTSFVSATNAGITLVGTDVKVAPGTPAGNYELVYKICENINLTTNCDDAIVKVKVSAASIEANDDTAPTAVNGLAGGTAFTNVLVNDKLNGVLVDPTKVTTSFVSATNAGITLVGTDVKVAPGTPAGDYELVYKICENINLTTNCDEAIVKVKVSAATIEANDDTAPTAVNGLVGGIAFTNVLVNDKLNGVLVDPTKVTTSFVSATNAGITLVGTDVKVAPGTPAGDYELVYKICENINLTTNCDDAIVKVKVSAASIEANDDTAPTAVNGLVGGIAFTNVLVNDKLNGVLVDPTKVTTSFVSATNAGITLVGTDVKVAPGTPAGDYELVYKICENINLTTNCDDAIVKVKVSAASIEANDDTAPTAVNGLVGGIAFTNVLVNDKLNGVLVDPTKVTTSFVSATNAGITLVGTDVKVAPGTPAGDYELVYKICENINLTTNCDDAIVKVKVSAASIEANDDTAPTAVNGLVGGIAFTNVLVNDKLNGVLVDPTKVTTSFVSATNAGITLVGTDVKVAPGTPAGDYELVYKICENINLTTNCDDAIVKVKVSAATIEANDDTAPTAVNGLVGGTAFTNVLVNDKLNGVLVDPTKVTTSFVSATNAGITLVGTDVKVAPGTPAGDYELVYKICENINLTTNCDEAIVKVKVSAASIEANDDTAPTAVNGLAGGTAFTNVLVNDKLNGVLVDPTKVTTSFVSATNAGITLVGTDVKVAPGTPAGDYELVYKICENINLTTNCDDAIVKVKVSAASIEANDDTAPTAVNGLVGGIAFTNVLVNDKLNGVLVDPTKVTTSFVSATNAGITLVGTDVKVAPGTPAGDYELVYKICENINLTTNCDDAIVKVKVSAATIEANDDTAPTAVNGLVGGTAFTNVLVNDKLNGVLVDPTKVTTSFVSATNAGITLVGTDVKVAPGTPAGDYELVYKICENINLTTNCDDAIVKVKVSAATIEANDDTAPTAVNGLVGGTAFTNVLVNDKLNGVLVDPTKVTTSFVSATNAGITLVGTDVKVAPGTPAGDYELVYKICENINLTTNCDEAIVKVKVSAASIEANDDTAPTAVNGLAGGTAFTNVLVNDKLNGVLVDPTKVTTSFVSATNAGITLVGTDVKIAPGTPAGDYELVYKICENINLTTNCDDAIVKVKVSAATIEANDDTAPTAVNGLVGGTAFTNVLVNDKLNGVLVDPTKVTTSFVSATNAGITLVGTDVKVAPGTPAGDYELVYKICENINLTTNCDDAIVKVKVSAATIEANDDTAPTAVNGLAGGTAFTNVLVNDKLNGVLVDPTKVTTSFVSATNAGITLVGTDVKVAPGTPAGDYELVYKICENINLTTNCDDAIVKVKVSAASIEANDDTAPTAVNGLAGGTAFTNVLVNDKLNGVLVDPTKVTTSFVSATNAGITLVGTDVKVAPGTPAGDYELVYKICENINLTTNCDEAIVKVKVSAATIEANDDTAPTAVNGLVGGIAFTNVLVNDKLNGVLVDPTKVTTSFVSATNAGITLVGTDVKVAPGTPAGDYELVYKICENINLTTNCDDAIVKVKVSAASIEANDDTAPTAVNGFVGGTAFTNVLVNDKLNNVLVDPTKVTTSFVSATNAGITLVGTDVKVAPGTPAGDYELVYKICENINLTTNCDEAIVKVKVSAATIEANDDTAPTAVNGFVGGTAFTNVLVNDKLNGVIVDPTKVTTSFVSATNAGITLVGTDVKVAPGTPAGDYELVYKICENINLTTNCDDAIVKVKVSAASIEANDDTAPTAVNGLVGGIAFTNVLVNDKLNGVLVDPTKVTTSFVSATNAGITLVGTDVKIAPGTPAGDYELVYKICENINLTTNCDDAIVKVKVSAATIEANNDTAPTAVNGLVGGIAFTNVLVNDKLNGVLVDPTKVTTSFVSATNAGITLVGTDVKVAPGTPAGDYELVYKICENINLTTNCDDAIVKVKVSAATIEANNDTAPTAVNGLAGGTAFTNVLVNDKLNGVLVDPTKVTTSFVSATNAGITLVGTDVKIAPGTPAGDYELVYKICENINLTTNCDDAIVKVKVSAATIEANNDTAPTAVNGLVGGIAFTNVLVNDKLNGVLVDPTKVTTSFVSATNAGITLVGTDVKVAPGTPAGDYELVYKICENINLTTNCDDAIVKVKVSAATIEANNDTAPTAVNGLAGGTAFTNVLVNDKLNGVLVDPTKVTTSFVSATNAGITLVGTDVKIAPGTPAGDYELVYKICENINLTTNCDDAIVKVSVYIPSISITKEGTYVDTNTDGKTNVGDQIKYTFTVKNTGGSILTGITVTDNKVTVNGGPIGLNSNESDTNTFSALYNITEEDINIGVVYNLALAKGTPPVGNPVTGTSTDPTPCTTCPKDPECLDCTMTPLSQNPSISITKDGRYVDTNGDGKTNVGDKINYTFVVKNTGNVTLTNVTVTDNNAVVSGGPIAILAIGTSDDTTFTATHTLTQEDINAGIVYNLATATAKDPKGNPVTGTSTDPTPCTTCTKDPECLDCTMTPLSQNPSIALVKTAAFVDTNNDGFAQVGEKINYFFTVKNTGDVTVINIKVTDPLIPNISNNTIITLLPGDTDATIKGTYVLTQADIDNGKVINTALAKGQDPKGNNVQDISGTTVDNDTKTETPLQQKGIISLLKTGVFVDENNDGFAQAGEKIQYNFKIQNTGNVTLYNISLSDLLPGVVVTGSPISILAIGEINTTAYYATYSLTQDDIRFGTVSNQASVIGKTRFGVDVTAVSSSTSSFEEESTVVGIVGCVVEPLKAVSPNGDGDNDVFYVRGLECYPENTVQIYNRWGVLVFEREQYNNTDRAFKGISEGRVTVSQSSELPTGTYYYIVNYKDTDAVLHQKAGYLYLNR
ncbi:gliding motility-associated C-terminal domain-containing protein [Flavobacterium ovatum]|uniref:DUF7507 domain-containing protein n=1 Tax=Flavobacterium ovatum TaxID=1928857 RepID=UPI00344F385F